jgi:protein gp37
MQTLDWRPVLGCSPVSAGCANCAGMRAAPRDLTISGRVGPVWSGRLRLDAAALDIPSLTAAPSVVAVCANGDLFHAAAPDAWIDQVFDRIERAPRHRFQVLTKRSGRMLAYVRRRYPGGLPSNVWLGVAAERQAEAEARLADLVATPSATRFAHFYPLLGPIDCARFLVGGAIAYVFAGQEPERPAPAAWFDSLGSQCAAAGVPFVASDVIVP